MAADHSITAKHILFECTGCTNVRNALWEDIIGKCPPRLLAEINSMYMYDKAGFLLNAFKCDFIPEWLPLYTAVGTYIQKVCQDHYERVKNSTAD